MNDKSDYETRPYIHVVGVRDCGGNAEDSGETCAEPSSKFDDEVAGGGGDTTIVVETLPMNHDGTHPRSPPTSLTAYDQ